jgi:hypothetical protein
MSSFMLFPEPVNRTSKLFVERLNRRPIKKYRDVVDYPYRSAGIRKRKYSSLWLKSSKTLKDIMLSEENSE